MHDDSLSCNDLLLLLLLLLLFLWAGGPQLLFSLPRACRSTISEKLQPKFKIRSKMEDDERRAEIEALEMMYSCNRISEDSKNKSISFRLELETLGLALLFDIPSTYPEASPPGVVATTLHHSTLSRTTLKNINDAFKESELLHPWKGENCLYDMVLWFQENGEEIIRNCSGSGTKEGGEARSPGSGPKEEKASMRTSNFKSNEEKSGILMNSTVEGEAASSDDGERKKTAKKKNATIKEELLHMRQWIWFIGFYTRKIIKAFVRCAGEKGLTGFLMPGKPGVACLEGPESSINDFLRITRTQLFASVAPSSRKMKLIHHESITSESRCFDSFSEVEMACLSGTHKRKDLTDLGELQRFLKNAGCGHAFSLIFNNALKT
eukprot:jgi/Bigna1/88317/estExt_fgenesh1_pg.C_300141